MMKKLITSAVGALFLTGTQVFGQAAIGSIAPDRIYSSFDRADSSTDFTQTSLRSHEGNIVVIYYYAGW